MKDNNNIVPVNIWCAGEYERNISSFTHTENSILTNKYSTIGESCINIKQTSNTTWINIPINISDTGIYTVTIDVLNNSGSNSRLRWLFNNSIASEVIIPQSNSWNTITLSGNVGSGAYLRLMQYGPYDNLFFDNICVKIKT